MVLLNHHYRVGWWKPCLGSYQVLMVGSFLAHCRDFGAMYKNPWRGVQLPEKKWLEDNKNGLENWKKASSFHKGAWFSCCPKDHWTLKSGYFEDPTPAIQVQTFPLEGPRSLGLIFFALFLRVIFVGLGTRGEIGTTLCADFAHLSRWSRKNCNIHSYCWWKKSGVNQLIGNSLSHYLQGFIHPRWCRISSMNSTINNW